MLVHGFYSSICVWKQKFGCHQFFNSEHYAIFDAEANCCSIYIRISKEEQSTQRCLRLCRHIRLGRVDRPKFRSAMIAMEIYRRENAVVKIIACTNGRLDALERQIYETVVVPWSESLGQQSLSGGGRDQQLVQDAQSRQKLGLKPLKDFEQPKPSKKMEHL